VQIKQGRHWDEHVRAEAEAEALEALAVASHVQGNTKQVLLLRLWGLMMAVTHRMFGVQFGGDVGRLVSQWQFSLQQGTTLPSLYHCACATP
jgi:hypothetical protein